MLEAGIMTDLTVARKAQFGYFLTDGEADILLHQNEAEGKLKEEQSVSVFLYKDHQDRLAATMIRPKIVLGEFDWLNATDVNRRMGVFLDMGIHKELLLSKDDLPQDWKDWPQKGDRVFVGLKHDKKGRLLAKLGIGKELEKTALKGTKAMIQKEVSGNIYRLIPVGAFLYSDEGYIGFLHRQDQKEPVRLGERITVRVKSIRDDGHLNISQLPSKQEGYAEDSEAILQVLRDRGGAMPFSDETKPEVIRARFKISKAAFKRAMGKLMKEGLVYQEEGWTYLKERR
jgi:uncharacterized protein